MKKLSISTVLLLLSFTAAQAQTWSINGRNLYVNPTTTRVGIGTTAPLASLHVNNGANTDGFILATSSENNKLIVRSLSTQPVNTSVFSILHEFGTNRNNGFINFMRGGSYNSGFLQFGTSGQTRMTIAGNGNVGIGHSNPYYKLDVYGTIRAHEVKINLNSGADFVFDKDYELMPINELSNYINMNRHLPDIAPADEMTSADTDLGEFQVKLLQKIEELTLYIIQQNGKIESLEAKVNDLETDKEKKAE